MKKCQIFDFFIIHVSLSFLKILSNSETWSPKRVRFAMQPTIYLQIYDLKQKLLEKNRDLKSSQQILPCMIDLYVLINPVIFQIIKFLPHRYKDMIQ